MTLPDLKTCLRPGIILALMQQYGISKEKATGLYDFLEAHPDSAQSMAIFPPAEEDEE